MWDRKPGFVDQRVTIVNTMPLYWHCVCGHPGRDDQFRYVSISHCIPEAVHDSPHQTPQNGGHTEAGG
jgi:hypothetical protein